MTHLSNCLLVAATVAVVGPVSVMAQVFPRHQPGCCETCTLPMATCQCARTRAVVQTQVRSEQFTTTKLVTETHARQEAYTERVPVTTMKNVTVDEGGYQMVWVPKPVTKQIAETTCVTQTKMRAVPYQVTRAVPQTVTRMVPYQTVHHVTEVVPTTMVAVPVPAIGCSTCATGTAFVPHAHPHATAMAPSLPITSTALTPIPQTAQGAASGSLSDWQAVPGRTTAPTPRSSVAPVPIPTDEPPQLPTPKTSGRFKPVAPSAAVVWSAVGSGPRRSALPAQDVAAK